jgi:DNA polymerase elongation subunit (family B)
MKKRNVLILDIETAPMLAYVFGRRDQNISLDMIKDDWYIIAWSAKWLGDPDDTIMYYSLRNARDKQNDKPILRPLFKLLDKADVVITQNGRRFDSRRINARFILQGIPPPSHYDHWDTLQLARRVADFTSNSLEYLTDKLCVKYKKLKHRTFPGISLWKECLAGNSEAWYEMEIYNKHDVLSTEELAVNLRAWAPKSFPDWYMVEDNARECGQCGSSSVEARGYAKTKTGVYPKFHCLSCRRWSQGKKIKEIKK